MNSFGRIFRLHIFGESHGESVGIVIDGVPAGLPLTADDMLPDLERRKGGKQKGTTPRQEADYPFIRSGVFNNNATGAPVMIYFENNNTRSGDYDKQRSIPGRVMPILLHTRNMVAMKITGVGGHFSARLTTGLVAAGAIAKKLLKTLNSELIVEARVIEIGGESDTEKGLQKAIEAKDSVGGLVECRVKKDYLPAWVNHFFDSVESQLAHILFAIPAVKGVEFGSGFAAARMFGSEHNDAIEDVSGRTRTNHAGGVVGGISNGNELVFRLAIKPTASTPKEQNSLNWDTGKTEDFAIRGRHDLCVALRAPVIVEAAAAVALVDLAMLEGVIPRVVVNNKNF